MNLSLMFSSENMLWIGVMLAGFAGSALCSGLETGSYAVNRIRLEIDLHQKRRGAKALRDELDHTQRLITTLLVGNNLANYLGTLGMGLLIAQYNLPVWQDVLINTLLITPILFIFGETLPKDLFLNQADRIMPRFGPVLKNMRRLLTVIPLVPVVAGTTSFFIKYFGGGQSLPPAHPRRRVGSLVQEGIGYGLLTADQHRIVDRVLTLGNLSVKETMVPWRDVQTIHETTTLAQAKKLVRKANHARLPVINKKHQPVGVINTLMILRSQEAATTPICQLMQSVPVVPPTTPVREALEQLRQASTRLAIIQATDKPIGIVTTKDLIEPITGKLAGWSS